MRKTTTYLTDKPVILEPSLYQLWDFAGIDALQVAKSLFGDRVARIAAFQSLETTLTDTAYSCSLLRLCENNFRVGLLQSSVSAFQQTFQQLQVGQRVWLKQFERMGAIALLESVGVSLLPKMAIAKPPHCLEIPVNCAVPARIDRIAVLVWRHSILGQPAYELHTAVRDLPVVTAKLLY